MSETRYPTTTLNPTRTTGLILCGMGGPDGPDAVAPFLRNLFADPAIFPVPRPLGPLLGRLIATLRASKVRRRYLTVSPDGATPQLPATRRQAVTVAAEMTAAGLPTRPGVAMRYWRPYPDQTVAELLEQGAEQFLVVPTYPQFSSATSGSTLDFVLRSLNRQAPTAPVHVLAQWPVQPGFVGALAAEAVVRLAAWADVDPDPADCALVYVAHSLPRRLHEAGDPYLTQVQQTVAAIHTSVARDLRARGHETWATELCDRRQPALTFQSRVGPVRWLGPDVTQSVRELARGDIRRLLVVPVSFTCEHIETLLELDVELKDHAARLGIAEFQRVPVPGTDPVWLRSLSESLLATAFAQEVNARD